MANDSWISHFWRTPHKGMVVTERAGIGIIMFEAASMMSKVISLWNFLSHKEIDRLREVIENSTGLQKLITDDKDYLMDLVLNEIIENFGITARSVSRLSKRCVDPIYRQFESFISDPINNDAEWFQWEYSSKKMDRKVRKMERLVDVAFQLSHELEVLAGLQQTLRRMRSNSEINRAKLLEFRQKVNLKCQEVKYLRAMSLWSRPHDYIVKLLVRSLFTILERINHFFGNDHLSHEVASVQRKRDSKRFNSHSISRIHSSAHMQVSHSENIFCGFASANIRRSISNLDRATEGNKNELYLNLKTKKLPNAGPFKGCMTAGCDSPVSSSRKPIALKTETKYEKLNAESISHSTRVYLKLFLFSSNSGLLNAPPCTIGDSALALRYAKVIILIEKLAAAPRMVGLDVRDELYNMLSSSIKNSLHSRLKRYSKSLNSYSIYDSSLAFEWCQALSRIFQWLVPIARNTLKWHSERNFEREHSSCRTNVLLVQTLHYANQAKTEATITELLVGLNYMCRIGREVSEKGLIEPNSYVGSCLVKKNKFMKH